MCPHYLCISFDTSCLVSWKHRYAIYLFFLLFILSFVLFFSSFQSTPTSILRCHLYFRSAGNFAGNFLNLHIWNKTFIISTVWSFFSLCYIRKMVLMGRDKHFSGLCHFFQSKFLMAPKVGISACMLDGVPSR